MYSKHLFWLVLIIATVIQGNLSIVGEGDFSSYQSNCPEILNNTLNIETPLYFYLTDGTQLSVHNIGTNGVEDLDIQLQYPPSTNDVRARLSPSGKKIALLFIKAEDEPLRVLSQATIIVIDLSNSSMISLNVALPTYIFNNNASSPYSIFGIHWAERDILWDWLDDTTLLLTHPKGRTLIDVNTKMIVQNEWMNPTDLEEQIPPFFATLSYAFYEFTHENDEQWIYTAVVDDVGGEIINSNLEALYNRFSPDYANNLIVYSDRNDTIRVYNAESELYTTLLDPIRAKLLPEQGFFFVNPQELTTAIYHSYTRSFQQDETFVIEQNRVFSLCLSGSVAYIDGVPSWSSNSQYQFALQQLVDGELKTDVWVYDPNSNYLYRVITRDTIEEFSHVNLDFRLIGWK